MVAFLPMLAALGCSGPGGDDADLRAQVAAALAEDVALARYQDFEARAAQLDAAAAQLCVGPDATALASARDAWWAAREPWKQAELVQFGPVVDYPERLGPKLDDWPVRADSVEELVAGDGGLELDDFDAMGSATRGLPVVEYLLWERGDDTLVALTDDPRRCAVMAGAAADVARNAALLAELWRTDWVDRAGSPDTATEDLFGTTQDAIDTWVNRMAFTVENVRTTKLGKPAGDSAGGEPQPDTIESRASGRSLTDAADALAGVRAAWQGGEAWPGVTALLADDPDLATRLDGLFDDAATATAAIPETLETSVTASPGSIDDAQDALQALQVGLQVELAPALGVTITFNDNDGD